MKKSLATIAVTVMLLAGCVSVKGNVSVEDNSSKSAAAFRHVVLFKFKDGTSDADIQKVQRAFLDLKKGIDTIRDIESGKDVSSENLQQGFTHCFIVTFDNGAGRDTYLTHPVHQDFVKLAGPFLDKALVIDFVPVR